MEADIVLSFCTEAFFLALAPGPDNLFVLSQSALFGIRAGLWVTLGLCSGLIFHTLAVVLGVAALLKANPSAMNILQLCGAVYLLNLARLSFQSDESGQNSGSAIQLGSKKLYLRGLVMNLTNPKVTMFFLAFLPQFVRESASATVSRGGCFWGDRVCSRGQFKSNAICSLTGSRYSPLLAGRGFGNQLLAFLVRKLTDFQIQRACLLAEVEDWPHQWYSKLGFVRVGILEI